jgi:membrane-associated protease RseP (regulator of RpoE activity)
MNCLFKPTLALAAMAFAQQLGAQQPSDVDRLNQQDARLAAIAERMLGANSEFCRQTMPLTGIVLHSRDQYRSDAGGAFANGAVAVAAVVPGSVAGAAGIVPGDAIAVIGSTATATMTRVGDAPVRDTAFAALADQASPVALTLMRGGEQREMSIAAPRGCR